MQYRGVHLYTAYVSIRQHRVRIGICTPLYCNFHALLSGILLNLRLYLSYLKPYFRLYVSGLASVLRTAVYRVYMAQECGWGSGAECHFWGGISCFSLRFIKV